MKLLKSSIAWWAIGLTALGICVAAESAGHRYIGAVSGGAALFALLMPSWIKSYYPEIPKFKGELLKEGSPGKGKKHG